MIESKEEWGLIEDFPNYRVNKNGIVKCISRKHRWSDKLYPCDKILKTRLDKNGYEIVNLTNAEREQTHKVHRLVANAFIVNPENKKEVNHINGIKTDNRVENIEWNTMSENQLHRYHVLGVIAKKKKFGEKVIIDNEMGIFYPSITSAAEAKQINPEKLCRWLNIEHRNRTSLRYA